MQERLSVPSMLSFGLLRLLKCVFAMLLEEFWKFGHYRAEFSLFFIALTLVLWSLRAYEIAL